MMHPTPLLFGNGSSSTAAPQFMWGNCWLYVQTGNESPEYAYHFQDKLALYVGLLGYHPLLLVGPGTGQSRPDYWHRAERFRPLLAIVEQRTGIPLPFPPCIGVDFDVQQQRIDYGALLNAASNETAHRLASELLTQISSIRYNQLTAMHAESLQHFTATSLDDHSDSVTQTGQLATLLMQLHDKAEYLQLVQNATADIPPHVDTQLLSLSEFPAQWSQLLARLHLSVQRLIVKSTQDDCGEVMSYLEERHYRAQLADLHQQVQAKASNPNRPNTENYFLVQSVVQSPSQTESIHGIPDCFGINFYLHPNGEAEFICSSKQLYADTEHKVHLGAYWSAKTEQQILAELQPARLQNLCRLFSDLGYHGPIGFDGMRDEQGRAILIFDCNPRMTGVLPVLAVRNLLRAQGVNVKTLANAGYHGAVQHDSVDQLCDWLDQRGMLFHKDRPVGVLPLPNFSARKTALFDVFFVNLALKEINTMLNALRADGYLTIEGMYHG